MIRSRSDRAAVRCTATLLLVLASSVSAVPAPDDEAAIVANVPLIERPVDSATTRLVIMLSGDGGWEKLADTVGRTLNARGLPVVGWSTLRYFWNAKSPEDAARDLGAVIDYYQRHWRKTRTTLIGYSRGAEVLPIMVRKLSPAARASIDVLVLLAPERIAGFEFHVVEWWKPVPKGIEVQPEIEALAPQMHVVCVYGTDDTERSVCPLLDAAHIEIEALPGGHHFDGHYAELAAFVPD